MAEVLGLASGVISVFSLAIQVASSIKILKDFIDTVKETPAEVRLALNEVEILSFVLQDIEQSVKDQTAAIPVIHPAVTKAIQLCKTSNEALEMLVQEVNVIIKADKRRSSIKAALKRDKLLRFRVQLDSTKTLLTLANQCYYKYGESDPMVSKHFLTPQ